jgi:DNA (cytosine-5)-methyltransferase 1
VDLFAGAGGLGLGFRNAGFRVALAVEVDRDAAQTYRLNHPGVPVLESDIAKLTAQSVRDLLGGRTPAVVCAGPPCQSYSAAGSRLTADPRHELYRHVISLAYALGPDVVVIENVPGMVERRVDGRSYREIVEEELAECFLAESFVLDATAFGVPQERRRLIFFGRAQDQCVLGAPRPTHDRAGEGGLERTPTVMETLRRLPGRRSGSTNDVAVVNGILLRNLATMRHSARVIRKIRDIVPGTGPLSYRRVPKQFAQTVIAGHRALPVHPTRHRTLSVREAAALQGFPDDYAFAGCRANQPLQVANAVPPPFAQAIAEHVMQHLVQHTLV